MFEAILSVLVFLIALFGMTELVHIFLVFLISPKKHCECLTVFLNGDTAVQSLKATLENMRWHGEKVYKAVIAVVCSVSDDDLKQIKTIEKTNENLVVCSADDFFEKMCRLKEKLYG